MPMVVCVMGRRQGSGAAYLIGQGLRHALEGDWGGRLPQLRGRLCLLLPNLCPGCLPLEEEEEEEALVPAVSNACACLPMLFKISVNQWRDECGGGGGVKSNDGDLVAGGWRHFEEEEKSGECLIS